MGILLFETLTGRPPFVGDTAQEIIEQVRHAEPERPSRLNYRVMPELDALCLRCLCKDPWHRFGRAYAVSKRLKQFLEAP